MNTKKIILGIVILLVVGLVYYLFRPLYNIPAPANFTCLDIKDGVFISKDSLPKPQNIYGMGLTYQKHMAETSAEYDPNVLPPIFKKELHSVAGNNAKIKLPTKAEMINATEKLDKEVADKLRKDFDNLSPMLDYEVELGFVLLESISKEDLNNDNFVPQLGYFIANDVSERGLSLLGEGSPLRYDFWGLSKSFPNFLPMSDKIWIPNQPSSNSIPCIKIETYVNGVVRQSETTDNMIFTPLEMLRLIARKYPNVTFQKGDMVLTGTPGGVAIATPRALVRMSNLLGFDRYKKLSLKLNGDLSPFLKKGDKVEVRGQGFESIQSEIIF
jgi:2-keto-4-pentenoate hydratase/2-oxohepta-3-ene-1,7-dioic acid hydratase in catechol pathway